MLADASAKSNPGSLAGKLSRCKEAMARFLESRYRVFWPIRVSRYRVDRKQVTSQGTHSIKAGSGAVAVSA